MTASIETLICRTSSYFRLEADVLKGARRDRAAAHARGCVIWLAFKSGASCADIGRVLNRGKFTVRQALDSVNRRMGRDSTLIADLQALESTDRIRTETGIAAPPPGYEPHLAAFARAYGAYQIARHTATEDSARQDFLRASFALSAAYTEHQHRMETE